MIWNDDEPNGIRCEVSKIDSNQATITITTMDSTAAGKFNFTVSINGVTSEPATLVIDDPPVAVKSVSIGGQQDDLISETDEHASLDNITENISDEPDSSVE